MESRVLRLVGVFALALAAGFACGEDDDGTGPEDGVRVIEMSNRLFSPANVTIEPGTTVRWVGDHEPHTITPNEASTSKPGVWEDVEVAPNGQYEYTFEVAGQTYDYFCRFHPGMTGRITVSQ